MTYMVIVFQMSLTHHLETQGMQKLMSIQTSTMLYGYMKISRVTRMASSTMRKVLIIKKIHPQM